MANSEVVIEVSNISIRLGDSWILEDVSFECRRGEWTLICGPSGSGKSTLLRSVNGLYHPARGCIRAFGTEIPGRSRREARAVWRQTGTVLQEVALFETLSALGNVQLALRSRGPNGSGGRARAVEWLERLNLGDKLSEYPCRLSGGEAQRVALARAFVIEPTLLILDEPTSALDGDTARVVLDAVEELARNGTAVVLSSHRVDECLDRCDQRVVLERGQVLRIERRSSRQRCFASR